MEKAKGQVITMRLVSKTKKIRRKNVRIVVTVVLLTLLLGGAMAGFIALCYYVDSLDTIFPNVWAEGVEISGLTQQEATQALINSGYEEGAAGISVTVIFPDESSFQVTGNDVGLALNASEAVEIAYAFGREGPFFENGFTLIKAFFRKTELSELSSPNYNDDILREMADQYTNIFNETVYSSAIDTSSNTHIAIIKGSGFHPANANDVFNTAVTTLQRAIVQHAHLSVNYLPESNSSDTIDLHALFEYIHVEPVSSVYDPATTSGTESSQGKTFNLESAEQKLLSAENGEQIIIPINIIEPDISKIELDDMLFRDVLAEREASQSSPSGRATNIRISAEAIDGTVLQPGQVFSYNQIVGPRTSARGFQLANGLISGRIVPSIGGGVCQVSSTIYAALLFTDLEIIARRPHGIRISYLPGGQDATVATDLIDFRFKNSSAFPIRIDITTTGTVTVSVKIYGTRMDDDPRYVIESRLITTVPIEIIERDATPEDDLEEELKPGETFLYTPGQVGQTWDVWKHIADEDGNRLCEDGCSAEPCFRAARDVYRMQPRVTLYGPPLPLQPVVPPPLMPPDPPPGEE